MRKYRIGNLSVIKPMKLVRSTSFIKGSIYVSKEVFTGKKDDTSLAIHFGEDYKDIFNGKTYHKYNPFDEFELLHDSDLKGQELLLNTEVEDLAENFLRFVPYEEIEKDGQEKIIKITESKELSVPELQVIRRHLAVLSARRKVTFSHERNLESLLDSDCLFEGDVIKLSRDTVSEKHLIFPFVYRKVSK